LLLLSCAVAAQPKEHEVKAAFLFKFLSFVEWPRAALPAGAPLVIGAVGGEDVAAELEQIVAGRVVEGRRVLVRRLPEGEVPAGVHLVFFGRGEASRLRALQRLEPSQPLLIVCDWEGALEAGAVVNFLRAEGRVRFEVALDAAERRGLRISSRMLAVAQSVRPARL
jgi:hypothetical protein